MELLVYKASAGSGKTFTLAIEYIKHLIADPRAYRHILAVTFTNKATAEMKERIVQTLYGLWKKDPSATAYLHCLQAELPAMNLSLTEEDIRIRAGRALAYMLHDYSRFRVETIDSFFQSVMRNLARELELSPNLNIELDSDKVLSDAVNSLIDGLTLTSPVLPLLLDYIYERIADDKRWNVSDEVKSFARNIFNEGYVERGEALRAKMRHPEVIRLYKSLLKEMAEKALKQMADKGKRFEQILEAHHLSADDLRGGKNSIGSYFRKLKAGKLTDKDMPLATINNSLKGANLWTTRHAERREEIMTLAERELLPLLREAESQRPQAAYTVNSCALSLRHLDKLQLLNHIDEEVRRLNHEANRFLLTDTNALLHRLISEGDSSFIYEKLGSTICHVMIDEFQDTSRMQWDNFRLLLTEGLSQGYDSLIVGDVKQSIYRWRNGDWTILNNLKPGDSSLSQYIKVKTLTTNRRSETRIINFNNLFFTTAVKFFNSLHIKELQEPCLPLQEAYHDVAQESPKAETKGYVSVQLLEADEAEDYKQQTLAALGNEVRRLLAEGIQLNDMAILVRKNKNIPPIADYFDKELGLPIVSDEAFRLDASTVVCTLVDAIRHLAAPQDSIAKALLLSDLGLWVDAPLPTGFTDRRDELVLMPLYELLEELYSLLALDQIQGQDAYLFAFFDAVANYLQDHSSDLADFVRYWDETLCSKTIPGGEIEGIRIFSIHKSKGLEFHTVLIPYCDWKLENETNNQLVWCVPSDQPYNELDLIPVTYSSAMATSTYKAAYLQERLQLWVDNLNLLYVAFTRAGKNLICWGRNEQKSTVSELLADVLPQISEQGTGSWDKTTHRFEYGTPQPSTPSDRSSDKTANRLLQKPEKLAVQMVSAHPTVTFRQSNRSADFIAGLAEEETSHRMIDRGRLLHTLFASIKVLDDIDPAIDRLIAEGVIAEKETEDDIRHLAHKAFSLPEVQNWYSGKWRLFNECEIIWQENGKLKTRRPDRVMMHNGETLVVDFKFGKPNKKYNRQVQGYIDLLVRMGANPASIKGYLWYVDEDLIETI
ncbi:MAG: UvrD-helicase domain-containing protein [Candidatus Bacteroides intestinipullorum]|uniref:DNA 3'-5' helicase n=1 Tax=Candidatus Bacteroides intestinipullorum TaxID=2838471 RepID=A0A9E2NP90_9BACE|nr:UvrD-helicase domain-containing protein [Candidatus Bacteroides intestinipullorum]